MKGAQLILRHLVRSGCKQVFLGIPFCGDQAVDSARDALIAAADNGKYPFSQIESLDLSTPTKRKKAASRLSLLRARTAIICTEDNVASFLWKNISQGGLPRFENIELLAMQGTGAINVPITKLRYDYRKLGRDAVSAVLERRRTDQLFAPKLIVQRW